MNYWLIIHKYESLIAHPNLIGFFVKRDEKTGEILKDKQGKIIPRREKNIIAKIKPGDRFAYYCPSPKQGVVGLFEIISEQGQYADDWNESFHFKTKPITKIFEDDYIPFSELVEKLDFFTNEKGEKLAGRAAGMKLNGTIKVLTKKDYEKLELVFKQKERSEENNAISKKPKSEEKISFHINMIKTSHLQAAHFHCLSFVGITERNRVITSLPDGDDILEPLDSLPTWFQEVSSKVGTIQRINYIDNIWFFEESDGFLIPFAVFEHEKDGNIRAVMDRFSAIERTLNSNKRFSTISPLYIIVSGDEKQAASYLSKIQNHGEWKEFNDKKKLLIIPFNDINFSNQQGRGYLQALTKQLLEMKD